jgi:hypothetical protein
MLIPRAPGGETWRMKRELAVRRADRVAGAAAVVVAGMALVAACTDPPGTEYGNPSGLRHENLPGEAGAQALTCGGDGGDEGGTGTTGTPGACVVSWSKDIYPNIKADGAWACASTKCHGGSQAPKIDATTPQTAYDSLKSYMMGGNPFPYVNPGSADPSQSTILCNLQGTCGNRMPIAPGTPLTPEELCKVDAWVRCSAPSN